MIIESIIKEQCTDPDSLAALIFQLARNESGKVSEDTINTNTTLRREIAQRVMRKAKALVPSATPQEWQAATKALMKYDDVEMCTEPS